MQLAESAALLGEQNRDFADVYKHYNFKDNQSLKEYLEFITHEPTEWFASLPKKYSSKNITKPKTALFKLLKHGSVILAIGTAYAKHVHDVVLDAYKKRNNASTPIETMLESSSISSLSGPTLEIEGIPLDNDAESIHSVKKARKSEYKARCELYETILNQMLMHHKENPLYETVLTLLKAASV